MVRERAKVMSASLRQLQAAGGKSLDQRVVHVPPTMKRATLPDLAEANLSPGRKAQLYPPPRTPDPRRDRSSTVIRSGAAHGAESGPHVGKWCPIGMSRVLGQREPPDLT